MHRVIYSISCVPYKRTDGVPILTGSLWALPCIPCELWLQHAHQQKPESWCLTIDVKTPHQFFSSRELSWSMPCFPWDFFRLCPEASPLPRSQATGSSPVPPVHLSIGHIWVGRHPMGYATITDNVGQDRKVSMFHKKEREHRSPYPFTRKH